MKLSSIGLITSGLMVVATLVMANTFTTGPASGIGGPVFRSQGLPPETPEQSTGLVPGTLRLETPVLPNTSSLPEASVLSPMPENSVLSPNSTGGTTAPKTGG